MVGESHSPVFGVKDYSLTLIPTKDFLKIDGEYYLESNFLIPDNFIELSHKLPNQYIDKLFLRSNDNLCNPSEHFLYCKIYKSSALIDIKNDPFFVNKLPQIELNTNFYINQSIISKELKNKSISEKNIFWNLQKELSNSSIKEKFLLENKHNISNNSFTNKHLNLLNLKLLEKIVLKKNKEAIYDNYFVNLYISDLSELQNGNSPMYLWSSKEKSLIDIWGINSTFELIYEVKEKNKLIRFDNFGLSESNIRKGLFEFPYHILETDPLIESVKFKGSLFAAKGESVNFLDINFDFFLQKEEKFATVNSEHWDNSFTLDHTWAVEKI